jgi:NMD protein affecting ribosome stability and mRNA decay
MIMPDSMDWVKSGMRSCDECGRETDAGEWPDWVNGICEDCDPTILFDYNEENSNA